MYIAITLIVAACLAFLPASIAERKGKSFGLWYLYGFFIWIVAILHAISLPELEKKLSIEDDNLCESLVRIPKNDILEVDINALAYITDYEITKENNDNLYISCKIYNAGCKAIRAVKIIAQGFNSFGDRVKINGTEEFELIIQDLNIAANDEKQIYERIKLIDNSIRKLNMRIVQISYADGTVETAKEQYLVHNNQEPLEDKFIPMVRKENSDAMYYMIDTYDYWQCVCGYVNKNTKEKCIKCSMIKSNAKKYCKDRILDTYHSFLKNEEDKEKRQREQAALYAINQEKSKKALKRSVFIAVLILIVVMIQVSINAYNTYQENQRIAQIRTEFVNSIQGKYVYTHKIMDDTYHDELVVSGENVKISNTKGTIQEINGDTFYVEWTYVGGSTKTERFRREKDGEVYNLIYYNSFLEENEKFIRQ